MSLEIDYLETQEIPTDKGINDDNINTEIIIQDPIDNKEEETIGDDDSNAKEYYLLEYLSETIPYLSFLLQIVNLLVSIEMMNHYNT